MFQHQQIWLPDGERHLQGWMDKAGEFVDGKGTYQLKKWRACLPWIKSWDNAIDIGSHVGMWAMQIAKRFRRVHCFEPMAVFRECAEKNLADSCNWLIYPIALGASSGRVGMDYVPADSGDTHVIDGTTTEMRTLDSFGFENVGFVKIDAEGYEAHIVEGARDTLQRCRPCVIVEQKQHKLAENYGIRGTPAVDILLQMGAKHRAKISGDHIVSWDS